MPPLKPALVALSAFVLAAPAALAHEREFTLSRDWFLPYKGESEVESRTSWDTRNNDFSQEFEYEYGVTDWFGIEPGIEFVKLNGEELEVEGYDIEFRFHFWQFAYDRVLPALNVEFDRPKDDAEPKRGEIKLIGSWYGEDGQDITLNLNGGKELGGERVEESEVTFGYVRPIGKVDPADTAYFRSQPRFGVEGIHSFHDHLDGLGPLFVYRGTEHLNLLCAYVFGLNERDENPDQLRLILEWEF